MRLEMAQDVASERDCPILVPVAVVGLVYNLEDPL